MTNRAAWDAGERLGDLVLAAERRVGRGRVITLGDSGCLTNSGSVRAFRFTGRLLAYLADKAPSPQVWWRQLGGLLAVLCLCGFVVRGARPEAAATSALLLAGGAWPPSRSVAGCGRSCPTAAARRPTTLPI